MVTIFLLYQLAIGGDLLQVDAFMTMGECQTAKTEAGIYYDAAKAAVPSFKPPRMVCSEVAVPKPGEPA